VTAGGTPDGQRVRRAQLANIRAGLRAPAAAIASYTELLLAQARTRDMAAVAPDLERILKSARELSAVVDELLDVDRHEHLGSEGAERLQARLRHDVRNPLGAIKGYAELLLEELQDAGDATMRGDIAHLLQEVDNLLASVDAIIHFARDGDDGGDAAGLSAGSGIVDDLVRAIRPLEETAASAQEIGSILVVDDNSTVRQLLQRQLEAQGHTVLTAPSGHAALVALESESVDLVLLDLIMPEINGFEILQRLQQDKDFAGIPVIVTSALDEMDSIVRCIEAGADDYLAKPFSPVLLRARINACLERKRLRDQEEVHLRRLQAEKERSEALLLNVLPRRIVERLNNGETAVADRFEAVSVVFADIVRFTELSSRTPPGLLVEMLNHLYSELDEVCGAYGIEKIKTIGDAYMAVSGLPEIRDDHAAAAAALSFDLIDAVHRLNRKFEVGVSVRVGVHSGPVVAGIIGTHKFAYDVWGDTVNTASWLERSGEANRVHVSAETAALLDAQYDLEHRGRIRIKGGADADTYFLRRRA